MTIKTQPETEYNLSTFRTNWKSRGFREAWRIDNAVTEARDASSPTLQDVHKVGKQMAHDVGGLYDVMFYNPKLTFIERATGLVCASIGKPIGYVGGAIFGIFGAKPKTLEAEVSE